MPSKLVSLDPLLTGKPDFKNYGSTMMEEYLRDLEAWLEKREPEWDDKNSTIRGLGDAKKECFERIDELKEQLSDVQYGWSKDILIIDAAKIWIETCPKHGEGGLEELRKILEGKG